MNKIVLIVFKFFNSKIFVKRLFLVRLFSFHIIDIYRVLLQLISYFSTNKEVN